MATIFETYTADYSTRIHYAKRQDGVWFVRYQERSPRGYKWGPWKRGYAPAGHMTNTERNARLPRATDSEIV